MSDPSPSVIRPSLDEISQFVSAASGKPPPSPDTRELRRLANAATLLLDSPLVGQITEAMLDAADKLDLLRALRAEKEPPAPPPPPQPQSRLAAAIENLSQAFRDIGLDPPVALLLRTQHQLWHLEACMRVDGFVVEHSDPNAATQIMGMQIQCLEKAERS